MDLEFRHRELFPFACEAYSRLIFTGRPQIADRRDRSGEFPGYNLPIMVVGLACVVGLAVVVATVRAVSARNTLNQNRMMRDYLRRIASDRNPDF